MRNITESSSGDMTCSTLQEDDKEMGVTSMSVNDRHDTMMHANNANNANANNDDDNDNDNDDDEIILDHQTTPFRFTRRRDRLYGGGIICFMILIITLSITLPLTKDQRRRKSGTSSNSNSNANKDWTMIGNEISNSQFEEDEVLGISLALSDDGTIIAVGNRHTSYVRLYMFQPQPSHNPLQNTNNSHNNNNNNNDDDEDSYWVQMGSDIMGNDDTFGYDVALSGDGYTVAIGGPQNSAVYVYKFNATQEWNMVGGSIRGDMFRGELAGSAIALSLDGRVIAVGAHLNSDNYQRSGQVRAFQLNSDDTKWVPLGSDINGEAFGDQFGGAISLSNDGLTLAVGARFHDDDDVSTTNQTNIGHVRVFRFIDVDWTMMGNDIEGDEAGEGFGYSVSLSGDGRTCAIGNTNSELAVYRQTETDEWLSIGTSIPPIHKGNDIKAYVSLSRDGNVLAVLEYQSYEGGALPTVIVFRYDEESAAWEQVGSALNGAGLALSADGSIVAVGGVNIEGLEYVRVLTSS